MQYLYMSTRKHDELAKHIAVLESQTFKDTTDYRTGRLRHRLSCLFAISSNTGWNIPRCKKHRIIRVNQRHQRFALPCKFNQFLVAVSHASHFPGTPRLLKQPKSHHILEESRGVSVAAFIGHIHFERGIVHNWLWKFKPQQGPGSRR